MADRRTDPPRTACCGIRHLGTVNANLRLIAPPSSGHDLPVRICVPTRGVDPPASTRPRTAPVPGVVCDDTGGLYGHDRPKSTVVERQTVLPRVRGLQSDPVAGLDGLHVLDVAVRIAVLPDALSNEACRLVVVPGSTSEKPGVIDTGTFASRNHVAHLAPRSGSREVILSVPMPRRTMASADDRRWDSDTRGLGHRWRSAASELQPRALRVEAPPVRTIVAMRVNRCAVRAVLGVPRAGACHHERVVITRNGSPAAVLMSPATSRRSRRPWRSSATARLSGNSPRRAPTPRATWCAASTPSGRSGVDRRRSVPDRRRPPGSPRGRTPGGGGRRGRRADHRAPAGQPSDVASQRVGRTLSVRIGPTASHRIDDARREVVVLPAIGTYRPARRVRPHSSCRRSPSPAAGGSGGLSAGDAWAGLGSGRLRAAYADVGLFGDGFEGL